MGSLHVSQSAAALTPGRRNLALEFDARLIADSGLRAPFELHDLRLVDQGRMFVLHRQARALALDHVEAVPRDSFRSHTRT